MWGFINKGNRGRVNFTECHRTDGQGTVPLLMHLLKNSIMIEQAVWVIMQMRINKGNWRENCQSADKKTQKGIWEETSNTLNQVHCFIWKLKCLVIKRSSKKLLPWRTLKAMNFLDAEQIKATSVNYIKKLRRTQIT